MRKKYHGTVYANGKTVYESWYKSRNKAVADLKQETREAVLNSFGESIRAGFTLSIGNAVIKSREIPQRRLRRQNFGPTCSVYGLLPVGGTRIC